MSSVSRTVMNRIALDPENPLKYRTFAAPVTNKPSICAAVSPSASAARRRGRRSVMRGQMRYQATQRQLVTKHTQATHHADRRACEHRVTSFGLARVDVRDVDLDKRHADAGQRISKRQAGVRVRAGIHEGAVDPPTHGVDALDQLPFPVLLRELELDAQLLRDVAQFSLDIFERLVPVNLRLSRAEQVQIGAIENSDFHRCL